ncbi:hypothetical protein RchiOBHm_Chr5g0006121 [Rosa chinensis]|uniref:Uncharacterized protein n=1 Tax=Rosa chinensis TaxID=74649 RepID=A0A2P6Q3H2_ROSCH|nr:hypothetical protein RchiOBHm_Chr5g0006121 [Rosa chinensis]
MFLLKPCRTYYSSPILSNPPHALQKLTKTQTSHFAPLKKLYPHKRKLSFRGCSSNDQEGEGGRSERKPFLTLEEAGLVEISGLSTHERFLCRLTISSLNLLRVISEQEGCTIEELNAGRICDWFVKDKLKREQNLGSAVLQWDDSQPF